MYIVFHGDQYYPSGGAKDAHAKFESLESAKAFADGVTTECLTWAHVWNTVTDVIEYERRS